MIDVMKTLSNFIPFMAGIVLTGAAVLDFLYYRLPNKLFYVIFYLFPLYIILSLKFHLVSNYSIFVGAILIGFGLFAGGIFGGGDAKFLSAGCLWAGWTNIVSFLVWMALCGGIIAAVYLFFPRQVHGAGGRVREFINNHARLKQGVRMLIPDVDGVEKEIASNQYQRTLPYGISIAAAGLITLLKGIT
jgi:prepilin peptidase CpaA